MGSHKKVKVTSNVSNFHNFWHGCIKEVAADFYGNFYFSTLVTNHLSQQNPIFQKCHENPNKNDRKNSRCTLQQNISIFDIWIFGHLNIWPSEHLTSEHLNFWTFEHWNIGTCALGTLKIWTFEHLNVWTLNHFKIWTFENLNFKHLNIWTFEHLKIWAFIYLNIWTFEHLNIWSSEHMKIWASEHLYIGTCRAAEIVESCHPGWKNTG